MTKREIEETLMNYPVWLEEIIRLRSMLGSAGERVVRSYEAMDMPKPQGGVSDPVYMESIRREKSWKRLETLERKLTFIQGRSEQITDERERIVLDCLLDGLNLSEIARHMNISPSQAWRMKESIVEQLCEHEKTPA